MSTVTEIKDGAEAEPKATPERPSVSLTEPPALKRRKPDDYDHVLAANVRMGSLVEDIEGSMNDITDTLTSEKVAMLRIFWLMAWIHKIEAGQIFNAVLETDTVKHLLEEEETWTEESLKTAREYCADEESERFIQKYIRPNISMMYQLENLVRSRVIVPKASQSNGDSKEQK
jgi:hypothetical protein